MIARNVLFAALFCFALAYDVAAQQAKPYRIGVLMPGGAQYETLNGLRDGLKEAGLEEGRQVNFVIKDTKGDISAAEEAAQRLEKDNVNLIYALTTTVIAKAKSATTRVPIVFAIGSDPVTGKLVDSFAKPGGRLTGVHYLVRDLTAKRLEVLKEILPKVSRVLTYYDPASRVAAEGAALARDEGKRLGIKLVERHVGSVDDLKSELQKLKQGEADAFFFTPDPMVGSQSQLIIDTTKAKKLPAMFQEQTMVTQGALASYGQNYREIGRLSAKYVQQVLGGAAPKDLKIETVDSVELAINLQTAKQLGITIPPQILARAQRVIK
ncbi:MAG TPA: ABC transporter substrate-binding protein [Terriglobales bacterium]|jgi:putative ABC transport system substrate-binding protein|nr:ABC transporter substrate-binding protein [Terriglobales bacterium]